MEKERKKIFAISGSTRKNSSNESILKGIAELYKDTLALEIYDGIDKLPHFNPDIDNENLPQTVISFRDKIMTSDGVLICTPEYVFSLPGSLKNAIEWSVSTTLFSRKPVAIIVASASGEKALESLELIMKTIEAKVADNSKLLIRGAKGKIGINGEIKDQETLDKIKRLVESFIESIDEEKPVSSFN